MQPSDTETEEDVESSASSHIIDAQVGIAVTRSTFRYIPEASTERFCREKPAPVFEWSTTGSVFASADASSPANVRSITGSARNDTETTEQEAQYRTWFGRWVAIKKWRGTHQAAAPWQTQ